MHNHKYHVGDVIKSENGRILVVLKVSKKDYTEGMNCKQPGLYGFYGLWYGNKNPLSLHDFGKIEDLQYNEYEIIGSVKILGIAKTKELLYS